MSLQLSRELNLEVQRGCVCENMSHYSAYETESCAQESMNIFEYLKANMSKTGFIMFAKCCFLGLF